MQGSMSAYLGSLPRFSSTYSAVDAVITTDAQKLQFLHGGELAVRRPTGCAPYAGARPAPRRWSWMARS